MKTLGQATDDLLLPIAIHALRRDGEKVKYCAIVDMYFVNGVLQTGAEVIQYASDLRAAERGRKLSTKKRGRRPSKVTA